MLSSVAQLLRCVDEMLAGGLSTDIAPLAVVDADGTLWAGDLGEEAFRRGFAAGVIQPSVVDGDIRSWAADWDVSFSGDASAWFTQLAEACRDDQILSAAPPHWDEHQARKNLYGMQSWAYAGGTPEQIRAYGERLFAENSRYRVFSWWPALLAGLRQRGVAVVIISGTHPDLLKPGVQALGIASGDVFGSQPAKDAQGRFQPTPDCALYGERKAEQVTDICERRFGARVPLLAFGDSVENTDRNMLEMASMAVAVHPSGKHLEGANRRGYWLITESFASE